MKNKINFDLLEKHLLVSSELDLYLDLVSIVKANMEHPEWLGDFSKADYETMLNHNCHILIYTYHEEFIGAGMLIPAREKDLEKFGLSHLSINEVVDYGPQMVHPNYTGNGLQREINRDLDELARQEHYEYAVSTVHPDNLLSIQNLLKSDFTKIGKLDLKRGPRNIYSKTL